MSTIISDIISSEVVKFHFNKPEQVIEHLCTDSRLPVFSSGHLFFALKGARHDGHAFVEDLYKKGIRSFVVSSETVYEKLRKKKNINVILALNTLSFLQECGGYNRTLCSYPVVGITGSMGKTMVKEWLYHLTSSEFSVVRSPRSYNSQIGVPLSLWEMSQDHDLAVIEAGISEPGEMEKLQAVINPDIGVFTALGEAHSHGFKNTDHKLKEKWQLFKSCKLLVFPDQYITDKFSKTWGKKHPKTQLISWGKRKSSVYRVSILKKDQAHSYLKIVYKSKQIKLVLPFTDPCSVENAITSIITAKELGLSFRKLQSKSAVLQHIHMRMDIREGISNSTLINDFYNSDLTSLEIALKTLVNHKSKGEKSVVLSEIDLPQPQLVKWIKSLPSVLNKTGIHRAFLVGKNFGSVLKSPLKNMVIFSNTESFIDEFEPELIRDQVVLIKGTRNFTFERISRFLQKKHHETALEIDLNKMVHNLNIFKSKLERTTKLMAMVKASSYGSGLVEIANVLEFNHVDYLAVAFVDEGIRLRQNGISLPIMVMNPDPGAFESLIQHNLEPEIFSLDQLKSTINACKTSSIKAELKVHLKLDTGMHRLGLSALEDAKALKLFEENSGLLKVQSVFSHLVASDDKNSDGVTLKQFSEFEKRAGKITQKMSSLNMQLPFLHVLNTSGIIRFPEKQMDMVRLGIGLYGITSVAHSDLGLEEIGSFRTSVSQVKKVTKGNRVGYGTKTTLKSDTTIATLPIGYADGYRRSLGNGKGFVLIHGKKAHTIGNICMDMTMVDVTNLKVKKGDEVLIFGKELPVGIVAQQMDTIPYEVITGISERVKRVYLQD